MKRPVILSLSLSLSISSCLPASLDFFTFIYSCFTKYGIGYDFNCTQYIVVQLIPFRIWHAVSVQFQTWSIHFYSFSKLSYDCMICKLIHWSYLLCLERNPVNQFPTRLHLNVQLVKYWTEYGYCVVTNLKYLTTNVT